jgi:SpoVK/Ycf46/Vps4 family AAA+-type ATPase
MDEFVSYLDRKAKEKPNFDNIVDIINASNTHFFQQNFNANEYTGIDNTFCTESSVDFFATINNKVVRKISNYDEWQNQHLVTNIDNERELKIIDVSVSNLSELLIVINENPYDSKYIYNVDLCSLHLIKSDISDIVSLIGMEELKDSVFNQLLYFIQRLHISSSNKDHDFKHTIISGPPGTGKTEVAKMIGSMYSKLGLLKNNVFRKVTRDDLIAGYLGQTAIKVKNVFDECGCIFIDEVYSLSNGNSNVDSFSKECIDTICEALSDRKNDLMVIVAGYEREIEDNFFGINPGLRSRFIWNFKIDKYTAENLFLIFKKKIHDTEWSILDENDINLKWFEKNYNAFKNYGRDMEVLFSHIKICHSRRAFGNVLPHNLKKISLNDIDNGFVSFKKNMIKTDNHFTDIPGFYI